jgi:hypothetical protein
MRRVTQKGKNKAMVAVSPKMHKRAGLKSTTERQGFNQARRLASGFESDIQRKRFHWEIATRMNTNLALRFLRARMKTSISQ